MTTPTTPPRLLSVDEVICRLGLSRSHVNTLIRRGTLRSVKLGRRRLISEEMLAEFIAELVRAS